MAVVTEELRISELCKFGVSKPLRQLSAGERIHELFRDSCEGPPFYSYHGAWIPKGPKFIPLWDHCDSVFGVRRQPDGLEFIEYDIETPDVIRVLSRTEQGFWAYEFDYFYECEKSVDDLKNAANAVGFRYLDFYLQARVAAEERLGTFESKDAWLEQIVQKIDRHSGENA